MKNQELFNEIDNIIYERGYGWTLAQRKSMQRLISKLEEPVDGYWLNGRFIKNKEVA
tara:strand:+ start:515 stop:685 length:171 start_codon:yes stop_codon:yes gene_type:complete